MSNQAKWNELADRVGDRDAMIMAASDNAYDTMHERHGRIPGTMSDPMWEEWADVALGSYDMLIHG